MCIELFVTLRHWLGREAEEVLRRRKGREGVDVNQCVRTVIEQEEKRVRSSRWTTCTLDQFFLVTILNPRLQHVPSSASKQ